MICRVSSVHGTFGMSSSGHDSGSSPWSPTLGTFQPAATTTMEMTRIAISGAGTTVVTRGKNTMMRMPAATSG